VVLGCRDHDKALHALQRIQASVSGAEITVLDLDLSSLGSVRRAAEQVQHDHRRLDLLVNNAGLGWLPYAQSEDGSS
jgi:NAD(P)-dependent dehydrogenase (short-subunit alcohol dehydrogenase family)